MDGYATGLPMILHYIGDGNTALCDGETVDWPPRGWVTVPAMTTCPACLIKLDAG